MSDPKKNSCKKLNKEKKFLHALEERKKIRATSWDSENICRAYVHFY